MMRVFIVLMIGLCSASGMEDREVWSLGKNGKISGAILQKGRDSLSKPKLVKKVGTTEEDEDSNSLKRGQPSYSDDDKFINPELSKKRKIE